MSDAEEKPARPEAGPYPAAAGGGPPHPAWGGAGPAPPRP